MNVEQINIIHPIDKLKQCIRKECRQLKPITEFHKNKASKDGLHQYCKSCSKELGKANHKKRREKKESVMSYKEDDTVLKQCRYKDCLQFKPLSCFSKNVMYSDGYKSWCKDCDSKYCKLWRAKRNELSPKSETTRTLTRGSRGRYRILEPESDIPCYDTIRRNIEFELSKKKKQHIHSSVVPIFPLDYFLNLHLISRPHSPISEYFLGSKTRDYYTPLKDDEVINTDEYCNGEPHSSFKDFMPLTEPDKSFQETARTVLENRGELLSVA